MSNDKMKGVFNTEDLMDVREQFLKIDPKIIRDLYLNGDWKSQTEGISKAMSRSSDYAGSIEDEIADIQEDMRSMSCHGKNVFMEIFLHLFVFSRQYSRGFSQQTFAFESSWGSFSEDQKRYLMTTSYSPASMSSRDGEWILNCEHGMESLAVEEIWGSRVHGLTRHLLGIFHYAFGSHRVQFKAGFRRRVQSFQKFKTSEAYIQRPSVEVDRLEIIVGDLNLVWVREPRDFIMPALSDRLLKLRAYGNTGVVVSPRGWRKDFGECLVMACNEYQGITHEIIRNKTLTDVIAGDVITEDEKAVLEMVGLGDQLWVDRNEILRRFMKMTTKTEKEPRPSCQFNI